LVKKLLKSIKKTLLSLSKFNKKRKILFLPLEIKSRELYPKLYLAKKALDQNYSCFIGDKAGIFRATKYFNNGVYFYKSINQTDTKHILEIKKKNNKYIVLDEEGGFTYILNSEMKDFISHRSSEKNVSLIDKFFNWGKFDYNQFIKKYPKFKKKFTISGGLRFEVCKNSIVQKLYKDQIKDIKKEYSSDYTLIISSHGVTSLNEIKYHLKSDEYFIKFKSKKDKQKRYKVLFELYKLNKDFKSLIILILKKFPNQKFILRPHPSENVKDWNEFLSKNSNITKNILIDSKNDLNALIFNSNGIINSKSASSIHAQLQDKPIISYVPKFLKYEPRLADFLGHTSKTKNDVLKNFKNFIVNKPLRVKIKNPKILYKNINNFKSKLEPSTIILNEIRKIYKSKSKINILKILILSPLYFFSDFFLKITKLRHHKLQKLVYRTVNEKMSIEGIKKSRIKSFFNNINRVNKVKILSFGKNCFFIYKSN
jgi:surface carbohydrate biosynthesis protein